MLDGADTAHHGIELQVFGDLTLLADACGIHQHELVTELVVVGLDAVAGGSGYRGDDIALLAQKGVGKGALAHVRLAHDCDSGDAGVRVFGMGFGRQGSHNCVQQFAGAAAVGGGDGIELSEAEAVELVGVVHLLAGVDLVHAKKNRLFAPPEHVGDAGIVVGYARGGLDHEDDYVGLIDGDSHLTAYGSLEHVLAANRVAAGVDHRKLAAVPVGASVMTVAGHARGVVHDCLSHSYQPVEEGGFTHVRPSYYRYQCHNLLFQVK